MSAPMASSTETIFVRRLGEGVDAWRPAAATRLDDGLFRLAGSPPPDGETWEFGPGALGGTDMRDASDGPVRVARRADPATVRRAG